MQTERPIFVTGAAGFIGFHVAQSLLDDGYQVVGIDSVNDYYPTVVKRARISKLSENAGFRFAELDLAEPQPILDLFAEVQPELVCHLAAQAGVRYSLTHPHAYLRANIDAVLNILEGCRNHGAQRLSYASSSSVYGGSDKMPLAETDRVDTPISLYAATKKANELMAHCYTHLYGFETVGLRFFNVYGTWGRPDAALWIFTEKILRGEPIQVFGQGEMQRDFTHVRDIVAGVKGSLFSDRIEPADVVNLGNHRSEWLKDMIALLEEACGRPAEKIMTGMQPGDVERTEADIDRAKALFDFEPTTPISVGIPEFVDWYRTVPELGDAVHAWRNKG